MSGVCGVVFRDQNRQLDPAHLSSMVRMLDPSARDDGSTENLRAAGLGIQGFPGRLAGVAELHVHVCPVVLAFYGSLYNQSELFPPEERTPDTFLNLLHLYLKVGLAFLQRLRGEFSVAIWDGREHTLHLATDPFRVHTLFYYQDPDKFLFASRIKSILAFPNAVRVTLNPEAIVDVVASSIIPTPKTILREVMKVPSGHVLTYRSGDVSLTPHWLPSFHNPNGAREANLAAELKHCLSEAVSVRLEHDGNPEKLGTFLSGGVDSTTVTGLITQLLKHPIKSFSIAFAEPKFNEINYARIAAQAYHADHHELLVTPRDAYDSIPVLLDAFDEPFGNASAIPTYLCAKMARDHGVNLLYAGDGGDELFAGNQRYATQHFFEHYNTIPTWLREPVLKPLVFTIADRLQWQLCVRAKKYIQRASLPYHKRISSYDFFNVIPLGEFLDPQLLQTVGAAYDPYAQISQYYFQAAAHTHLDRHLYVDWHLTLADNDLIKVGRTTEATGVTVRFPFVDHRLVEFSLRVPAHIKMRGGQLRSFFKKAYADLLPMEVRRKKKHGFGLPIPIWLRSDRLLNDLMHDLLLSPQSLQRGYFRKNALEELVARHKTDLTSFCGTVIWNLMMLELWHRTHSI